MTHAEITKAAPTCVVAWGLMSEGWSLKDAASVLNVDPNTLDRALWHWRAAWTQSNPTRGAANRG
jgi:hypothetical protein